MTASAEEAADTRDAPSEPAAKAWLDMQRSGAAASKQPQPLSGPAMERVHERYLRGFEHPIPMYFEHAETISK